MENQTLGAVRQNEIEIFDAKDTIFKSVVLDVYGYKVNSANRCCTLSLLLN